MSDGALKVERLLVDERTMAAMIGVSPRKLFSLRKAGKVPFIPIGTLVKYVPGDVVEALRRRSEPDAGRT